MDDKKPTVFSPPLTLCSFVFGENENDLMSKIFACILNLGFYCTVRQVITEFKTFTAIVIYEKHRSDQ